MMYRVPVVLANGHHREPIVAAPSPELARERAATLRFGGYHRIPGPVPVVSVGEPESIPRTYRHRLIPPECLAGRHRWDFRGPVPYCRECSFGGER